MKHLLFIFFSVASSVLSYGFNTEFELKWIPLNNAMYELTIIDSSIAFDELADPTVVLYDRYGGHHPQVSLAVIDSKHSITFSNIGIGKSTDKKTGFIDLKFLKLCEKKRIDTTRYYAWDIDISQTYSVKKMYPIRLSSKKKLELETTDVELSNKIERYNATESLPESVTQLKEILFNLKDEDPLPFLEHITSSLMTTVLSQQDSILLNYLSDLEAISVKIAELAVQKENPDKKILENLFLIIQWIKDSYFQASIYSDIVSFRMDELEILLNKVYANPKDVNNEKNMKYLLDRMEQIFASSPSSTITSKDLTPLDRIQNSLNDQEIVVEMFWATESIYCFFIDHTQVRIVPLLPKKDLDSFFNEVDLSKPAQLSAIYSQLSIKMEDFISELTNFKRAYLRPIYLFHSMDVSNFTSNGKHLFETMEIVTIKDYSSINQTTKMVSTKNNINMIGNISYESSLTKNEPPIFSFPIWTSSSGSIKDTSIIRSICIENLPSAKEEVDFVQAQFPDAKILSKKLTEDNFIRFFNTASSGVFIYSGHGFIMLNPRDKRNFVTSGLLLSDIQLHGKDWYYPSDDTTDAVFSYQEMTKYLINNPQLELVILNACVASVGKIPSINYQPTSVATAFQRRAANASIISSTTYVGDEFGTVFTTKIFSNLKEEKDDLITAFFKAKRSIFLELPESADISLTGNFILLY